jgi:hypothetical protein
VIAGARSKRKSGGSVRVIRGSAAGNAPITSLRLTLPPVFGTHNAGNNNNNNINKKKLLRKKFI